MKRKSIFIIALLHASIIWAGGDSYTQRGIAYLYDCHKKTKTPIANVSITAVGAEPTTSKADGTFEMSFDLNLLKKGDKITLSRKPYYSGMKVFNQTEVDNWNVGNYRLSLVMCDRTQFEELKYIYIEQGKRQVEGYYRRQILALKKSQADYQQRLEELEEEKKDLEDNLRNIADMMARLDQSEMDDQMRKVMGLYENGDLDSAMRELENMQLNKKIKQQLGKMQYLQEELDIAKSDLRKIVVESHAAIGMFEMNGDYEKAAYYLKLLADELHTNEARLEYAAFCLKRNQLDEAELYYRKVLASTQQVSKDGHEKERYERSVAVENLGTLYSQIGRIEECERFYREALIIREELAEGNFNAYQGSIATTLNNWAILLVDTNDGQTEKARQDVYDKALKLYQRIIEGHTQEHGIGRAATLNNLANLYMRLKRYDDSERAYLEALEDERALVRDNPEEYQQDLAATLNNFATLYYEKKKYEECGKKYLEALAIYEDLVQKDSSTYQPYVSAILKNLSIVANDLNKKGRDAQLRKLTEGSEGSYIQALEIRRKLAKFAPDEYELDVASTLYNLAVLKTDTHHLESAESLYKELLALYEKLAVKTDQYKADWAGAWGNRSWNTLLRKDFVEAEEQARKGLSIDSTKTFIFSNLAASLLLQGKYQEAEKIYAQYKSALKESFLGDFEKLFQLGLISKEHEEEVRKIRKNLK